VLRVRPKAMTVAVIIAGLVPIMIGAGTGSEVMQRIAAPMVGGMITAPLLSMFVVPAVYLLLLGSWHSGFEGPPRQGSDHKKSPEASGLFVRASDRAYMPA
jgi:predicted RND superfamily exporter protein